MENQKNIADARLITGDQGTGKTCTATALVVDDVHANINSLIFPTGEFRKAETLKPDDIDFMLSHKISYDPLKHMRVFSEDGETSKVIVKPKGCIVGSPVKVFANYHFYGIKSVFITLPLILEHINDRLFTDGWLVLDESTLTDKRDTMTREGKLIAKLGALTRRRGLHTLIISQYVDMVQSRFNRFATTRVACSYDKKTKMITLDVNQRSEFMRSTSFYEPKYRPYYKHDEIVEIPQNQINEALKKFYESENMDIPQLVRASR
jgi:hypothetical protein